VLSALLARLVKLAVTVLRAMMTRSVPTMGKQRANAVAQGLSQVMIDPLACLALTYLA
jgi:hypothetical protein